MISPRDIFRLLPDGIQKNLKSKLNARAVKLREINAAKKLEELAQNLSANVFTNINNLDDWEKRKHILRLELTNLLGIDQLSDIGLKQATKTGILNKEKYTIEKWLFEYENSLYATANLYMPKNAGNSMPCVIYLCGHWPSLDGAKTGLQDRYLWYPENGLALLVIDPLGFGEINGIHHGTCRLNKWDWLSKGYTPAGAEVWNAMQLIDWLQKRSEIDINRLAVTGISGGGVMTQYLSAIDTRVKIAAASCSTYTIGHQVTNNLINGQCDCTYYHNIYQIDFPEVLALIAPRPFLILGGKKDDIFPPEGFRAAYSKVQKIFDYYPDGQSKVKLVESNEGHTDPPHFLEETRKWLCEGLNHEIPANSDYRYLTQQVESHRQLRVTSEYPKNAINTTIDARWGIIPASAGLNNKVDTGNRKEEIVKAIRNELFGWFPNGNNIFNPKKSISSGGFLGDWTNFNEFTISTESDVEISVKLCLPKEAGNTIPLLVWIKEVKDNVYFPDVDVFFPFLRSHALLIINPRFTEEYLSPNDYTRIERTSAILGRSIATQQIWDVLQALRWIKGQNHFHIQSTGIYGEGNMAIAALYAALLEPTISHVIMKSPPETHQRGPAIPMILRYADIPEIAACVAPARLTLINDINNLYPKVLPYFETMDCTNHINSVNSITELFPTR